MITQSRFGTDQANCDNVTPNWNEVDASNAFRTVYEFVNFCIVYFTTKLYIVNMGTTL